MEELSKNGQVGHAAMKAGMDRKTARKYAKAGMLPSAMVSPRDWRTRQDPFAGDWPLIEGWLGATPELDAKSVLEMLCEALPGKYEPGQMRNPAARHSSLAGRQGP